MKLPHLILSAALAASLVAGCSRKPKNITPLPASERVGGGSSSLPTGRPVGGGGDVGRPLPPTDTTGGTDLPKGSGLGGDGNASQPDRSKWESWPQDPDALRADTVYFDFDKSVVRSADSSKVSAIAAYLKAHPGYMVKLDGHADERGTEDYNRALGERRALSVREMLLNLGISQDSVVTATFGEDRPAELGHNEAAWAKNRRVEPVVLIPPGATR